MPTTTPTGRVTWRRVMRWRNASGRRILSLSDAIVRRWGRISGEIKRESRHAPPVIDTMLAATAIEHELYLVTRNVKDTRPSGAMVFDPWNDEIEKFPLSPATGQAR